MVECCFGAEYRGENLVFFTVFHGGYRIFPTIYQVFPAEKIRKNRGEKLDISHEDVVSLADVQKHRE